MLIIVEDGTGRADANSFVSLQRLVFYRDFYGFLIPATENEQKALLLRAAQDINARQWKGAKAHEAQAMAWPRRDCVVGGQLLAANTVPLEIEWGQLRLVVELYAAEHGMGVPDPAFSVDEGAPLLRPDPGAMMRPAPYAPSRAQFADYLVRRGLTVVQG